VYGEALTGERASQPLSHEIFLIQDADVVTYTVVKTNGCDIAGPIQNRPRFARMQRTWQEIQEAKAPFLYQGEVPSEGVGLFFPVTLLDNPPAEAASVIRENFGPLRAVIKYQDLDEAVRLANGTPYGLGASVWGTDPESLDAIARRLEAGTVWINQHLNVHPNIPFSGHKSSGIGIEFSEDGLKEFCNVQVIANRR
jgi:acyl-CoA reductase-like NAD-dependent aldehyde dehydrogenase